MYAKIKENAVAVFPYTDSNLKSENPSSNFDGRFDVKGWFDQTDEAIKNGFELVEVEDLPFDKTGIDLDANKISKKTIPEKVNSKWVLGWSVSPRTPEELSEFLLNKQIGLADKNNIE